MYFSWKRWRLALIAALTALAVSVAFAGPAAAAEPGESNTWNREWAGNQYVAAQGSLSEARNGSGLLDVWRGADNNQVWLSFDNGYPFTLGTTATYVSPTVVPWGPDSFMVFHTGVDGNIYYTYVYNNGSWAGEWAQVYGQTTNMSVSAAQLGGGSYSVYMVYRGVGNDNRLWGIYYDGATGWGSAVNMDGGYSPSAPSVTYNANSRTLFAVARGEDNQVWINSQPLGGAWGSWRADGGNTLDAPHIAATSSGYMLVDYLDDNLNIEYRQYDLYGNGVSNWQPDTTGYQTLYTATLSVIGAAVYAIMTGMDGYVYYKQAYSS